VCDALVQTGAPVSVALEGVFLSNLKLTGMENGEVLVSVKTLPFESPGPVPPTVRFATVNALGAWPSGPIPPLKVALDEVGSSYLPRPTGSGSIFEALFTRETGQGLVGPVVRMTLGGGAAPTEIFAQPGRVRSWARGEGWSLAAVNREVAPGVHRLQLVNDGQAGATPLSDELGCATEAMEADALWKKDRFLLALSSSRPPFSCNDDDGIDAEPTRVQLYWQGETPGSAEAVFQMDHKKPVRFLRLLRRGAGAWLVTGVSQDSYNVPLAMIPVMEQGFPGAALVPLTGDALIPAYGSVASMSDERVGVAYAEEGGQVPHLMLRAVSLDGAASADVGPFFATATALASPAPDTLVIGWIEGGGAVVSLRLARYQCVKAE
jgi:hypothetical protein